VAAVARKPNKRKGQPTARAILPRPAPAPPADLPDALRPGWALLAPAALEAGTLTPATVPGLVDGCLAPRDLARWILARIGLDGLLIHGPLGYQAHPLLAEYVALLPAIRAGYARYGLAPPEAPGAEEG